MRCWYRAPYHHAQTRASVLRRCPALAKVKRCVLNKVALCCLIQVVEDGHNSGRPALLKAESKQEMEEWVRLIRKGSRDAVDRLEALKDTMAFAVC